MDKHIGTLQDINRGDGVRAFVSRWCILLGTEMPRGEAESPVIVAAVNHGRWVAECPWCRDAQRVDLSDPWFYCVACGNAENGHLWVPVKLPAALKAIEHALLERSHEENRNWLPHETVVDLLAQTLERERPDEPGLEGRGR